MMITFYKEKLDTSLNYYTVHDRQTHLFTKFSFTVIYGVNLKSGREKVYSFKTRREMEQKLRKIFNDRINKGYTLLYSYPSASMYIDLFEEQKRMHA